MSSWIDILQSFQIRNAISMWSVRSAPKPESFKYLAFAFTAEKKSILRMTHCARRWPLWDFRRTTRIWRGGRKTLNKPTRQLPAVASIRLFSLWPSSETNTADSVKLKSNTRTGNATTAANANTARRWPHGKPRRPMKSCSISTNASNGSKLVLHVIEENTQDQATANPKL